MCHKPQEGCLCILLLLLCLLLVLLLLLSALLALAATLLRRVTALLLTLLCLLPRLPPLLPGQLPLLPGVGLLRGCHSLVCCCRSRRAHRLLLPRLLLLGCCGSCGSSNLVLCLRHNRHIVQAAAGCNSLDHLQYNSQVREAGACAGEGPGQAAANDSQIAARIATTHRLQATRTEQPDALPAPGTPTQPTWVAGSESAGSSCRLVH